MKKKISKLVFFSVLFLIAFSGFASGSKFNVDTSSEWNDGTLSSVSEEFGKIFLQVSGDGDGDIPFSDDNNNDNLGIYDGGSDSVRQLSVTDVTSTSEVEDIDGDGRPEFAYEEQGTGDVKVFHIGSRKVESTSAGAVGGIGDLDNDGKMEMAYNDGGELKYLNYDTDSVTSTGIANDGVGPVVDFNGDGDQDIVYENQTDTFQYNISYYTPAASTDTVTNTLLDSGTLGYSGDIGGDNDEDVIFVSSSNDCLSYYDTGSQSTTESSECSTNDLANGYTGGAGDIDGDNNYEIAYWEDGDSAISAWDLGSSSQSTLFFAGILPPGWDVYDIGYSSSGTYTSKTFSKSNKQDWKNVTVGGLDRPGSSGVNVTVETSNDGFSTVLEQQKVNDSFLSDGTNTYELNNLSEGATDVRFKVQMERGSTPTADSVEIQGVDANDPPSVGNVTWNDSNPDFGDPINLNVSVTDDKNNLSYVNFSIQEGGATILDSKNGSVNSNGFWISDSVTVDTTKVFYNGSVSEARDKEGLTSVSSSNASIYIDNAIPAFNDTEIQDDRKSSLLNLIFGIDNRGENDISSYTGSGSKLSFTNVSLELDKSLPISDNYSVTDFDSATSTERKVDVSTVETGVRPDDYRNNLSYQQVNESVKVVNDGSSTVTYNLTLQNRGTIFTSEEWSFDVSSNTNKSRTGVWSGDWINHQTFNFRVVPNEVDLDKNYTGTRALQLEETKGITWDNLSTEGFVSTPGSCGQSNSSFVGVSASSKENKSIGFDCDTGSVGSPALTDVNKTDYTRYWYNTTWTVDSNLTEDTRLTWPINENNLNQYDNRDSGSLDAYVDGETSDLEVVDGSGTTYVTVQTDFGNSSLHEGDHNASLTYTEGKDSGGSSGGGSTGGGSSGGGDDDDTTIINGSVDRSIGFSDKTVEGVPGDITPDSFKISNFLAERNTVNIVEQSGQGCRFVKVMSQTTVETSETGQVRIIPSNEFSDRGSYELPSREQDITQGAFSDRISVRVRLPRRERLNTVYNGTEEFTCQYSTSAVNGRADNLTLTIRAESNLQTFLNGIYNDLFGGSQQVFVERDICLDPMSANSDNCPSGLLFSGVSLPAANVAGIGFSAIIVVLLLGLGRLGYWLVWQKTILGK